MYLEKTKKLFELWHDKELNYCHFKSIEHLNEALNGFTDMDILVSNKDRSVLYKTLFDLDFIQVRSKKSSAYNDVEDWIGLDDKTGKLLHLHIHYSMVTGLKNVKDYILPWSQYILDNKISDSKFYTMIIDPNIELILLYSRIVLKMNIVDRLRVYFNRYRISSSMAVEIDFLNKKVTNYALEHHGKILFKKYTNDIIRLISTKNANENIALLSKYIRKELKETRVSSFLLSNFRHYFYKYVERAFLAFLKKIGAVFIFKKTISKKGVSIAFIGADGSGKSTLTNDISKWLSWKLDNRIFYFGSGDSYRSLLKKISKTINFFLRKDKKGSKPETNLAIISSKNSSFKKRRLKDMYKMLYLLRISSNYKKTLKKSKKYQKLGGVALYDRFPQNQFSGINDGPKIEYSFNHYKNYIYKYMVKKEKKNIDYVCNQSPNLVIKLNVSPEISKQRKPDHNFEAISQKAAIIKRLDYSNTKIININANIKYEEVLLEVKKVIWNALLEHSPK